MKILDILFDFLDNWNEKYTATHTQFGVYIGYNGECFVYSDIQKKFEGLGKYWNIYGLDKVTWSDNILLYQFRVYDPCSSQCTRYRLITFAKAVAETVLTEHMREHGDYTSVSDLVAVSLEADMLYIYISRNPLGISDIQKIRDRVRP